MTRLSLEGWGLVANWFPLNWFFRVIHPISLPSFWAHNFLHVFEWVKITLSFLYWYCLHVFALYLEYDIYLHLIKLLAWVKHNVRYNKLSAHCEKVTIMVKGMVVNQILKLEYFAQIKHNKDNLLLIFLQNVANIFCLYFDCSGFTILPG